MGNYPEPLCTFVAFCIFCPALNSGVGRSSLLLLRNSDASDVGDQSGPGWYGLFGPDVSPSWPLIHTVRHKEVWSAVQQSPSLPASLPL